MIALNIHAPGMKPLIKSGQYMELQHNLMHTAQASDVVMARVNAEVLVRQGQLLCDDLEEPIQVADSAIRTSG